METAQLLFNGIALGKKLHDKRDDIKRRDDNRDIARAMKRDYD